ncbi:hypothetical protein [Saccharobesus litoralis]|nr:hypothetical protein [Saccharobesus litoralis]
MRQFLHKIAIIILVLFAFIGQTMAYVMATPCEAPDDTHHAEISEFAPAALHQQDNHSQQMADKTSLSTSQDDCCDIECCDVSCPCVGSACSSVVYIPFSFNPTIMMPMSESIDSSYFAQANSVTSSVFRPPIFTS